MRALALIAAVVGLPACGIGASVGTSLARSGTQTIRFTEEISETDVTADVEVSSRCDSFDLIFLADLGPFQLVSGYGAQITDVRARDVMAPAPGVAREVDGAASFNDRFLIGGNVVVLRQPGGEVRPYFLYGVTVIARELTFGARPMSSLEAGLELDLFDEDHVGLALRLGIVREGGYAERVIRDEFGFEDTARGRYTATGFVATMAFRWTNLFGDDR